MAAAGAGTAAGDLHVGHATRRRPRGTRRARPRARATFPAHDCGRGCPLVLGAEAHRDRQTGEWKLDSTSDEPRTVTCEWIGVTLFVEPGSTAGQYRYRLALKRAGNVRCKGPNQLPLLGESLEMDGGVAAECEQPPRVLPAEIEPWARAPRGAKTLSLKASSRCSGDGSSTTESASVTMTLVPCNGAPCM